uniref:Uncharacterized protein n=1 Tax=Triticum urartu TaxID=4572 RepID=A0A8R7PS29_TRIUA
HPSPKPPPLLLSLPPRFHPRSKSPPRFHHHTNPSQPPLLPLSLSIGIHPVQPTSPLLLLCSPKGSRELPPPCHLPCLSTPASSARISPEQAHPDPVAAGEQRQQPRRLLSRPLPWSSPPSSAPPEGCAVPDLLAAHLTSSSLSPRDREPILIRASSGSRGRVAPCLQPRVDPLPHLRRRSTEEFVPSIPASRSSQSSLLRQDLRRRFARATAASGGAREPPPARPCCLATDLFQRGPRRSSASRRAHRAPTIPSSNPRIPLPELNPGTSPRSVPPSSTGSCSPSPAQVPRRAAVVEYLSWLYFLTRTWRGARLPARLFLPR